ncbi:MAG: helix-turn-helix domain-containing protein [Vibrio sp.]
MLVIISISSAHAIENDAIFYSLPSQTQGQFLTAKNLFPSDKGGIWLQDIQNKIFYFDGQHIAPLPAQTSGTSLFSTQDKTITYADGAFWQLHNNKLVKILPSGKFEVVFQAEKDVKFESIGVSDGYLWFYGSHGFYSLDLSEKFSSKVNVSQTNVITDDDTDENNTIQNAVLFNGKWIVATSDALFYLEYGQFRRVATQPFFHIQNLQFDKNYNRLLVSTHDGLFELNMSTITPQVNLIVEGLIQAVLITKNDYWVGTKRGLFIYNLKRQQAKHIDATYQDDFALSSNNVMALAADNQNGIWIATSKGVNYFSQIGDIFKRIRFGGAKYNLPYVEINDVVTTDAGTAWLATGSGLYKVAVMMDDDNMHNIEQILTSNISHLALFEQTLWLTTKDLLWRLDINTHQLNKMPNDGWSGEDITHLTVNSEGNVWLSTEKGIYQYSPGSKTTSKLGMDWMLDTDGSSSITYLSSGKSKDLWIGTDQGIYRYQDKDKSVTFDEQSVGYGSVISLSEANNGRVWGANSYGLALFQGRENNNSENIALKLPLLRLNSVPLCVASTGDGAWVTTTNGLNFYNQNGLLVRHFSSPFGLVRNEFLPNGCSLSPEGDLLTLTTKLGMIAVETKALKQTSLPIDQVFVSEVQSDHSTLALAPKMGEEIHVDYAHSLSVKFGVLPNFDMPQLQYRLIGSQNEQWISFRGSQLTFDHLAPGRYSLEFKTTAQMGTNKIGNRYVFIVDKPWYMLPWTVALFGVVLLCSVIGFIAWRSKLTVKANLRLRRLINLKTQQLRHQSQLLVSSNVQLRKLSQTRKMLVGDMVYQARSEIKNLRNHLSDPCLSEAAVLDYTDKALEPLNQIMTLYSRHGEKTALLDGQVVSLVLKAVITGWQQEADKSGITILVEDNTQGCFVRVKHFNLDMILNTLMASSLIRSDPNQIIHLSAKLNEQELRISIEDIGEGLSEEEILAFEAQEFGVPVVEHNYTLSDTSLPAIAHIAEQSGGQFEFHFNQYTHLTRLSIAWPIQTHPASTSDPVIIVHESSQAGRTEKIRQSLADNREKRTEFHAQNDWLEKVYQLVQAHYQNPEFSTSHAAKMLYISERSLQRKFKSLTNSSFMDYLIKVRLEKACELLISGEKISETAFESGFNDPSYFSQRFKQYFGVTPTKFIESAFGSNK